MTRDGVAACERARRSPGTDALADVSAADAVHRMGPRDDGAVRRGPDGVVAVGGHTAVVRADVRYGRPTDGPDRWRDLWLRRFDGDGRCAGLEEWATAPR